VERTSELATLPADVLLTRLKGFTMDHMFMGTYAGPGRGDIQDTFQQKLARMFATGATPRLSGVQIKAPHCAHFRPMRTRTCCYSCGGHCLGG